MKIGQMKRTCLSLNIIIRLVVDGQRLAKNYQEDPKTRSRTDSTPSFRRIMISSTVLLKILLFKKSKKIMMKFTSPVKR